VSTGAPSARGHPFGRGANVLVVAGTTLSIVQSAVVAIAAFLAPATDGFEVQGAALLVWLVVGVGLPALVGWTAVRALRSWWRRSVTVVPRLIVAGALAVPSTLLLVVPMGGGEQLTPIGYLPAGLAIVAGAVLARPRVADARARDRGGLSD
jgi:hypothetical protein